MNNGDELAFGKMKQAGNVAIKDGGLTKREYAAIKIMAGLVASSEAMDQLRQIEKQTGTSQSEMVSKISIKMADALLKELEK